MSTQRTPFFMVLKLGLAALLALSASGAFADGMSCLSANSDEHGASIHNRCDRTIIVTFCFDDGCEPPMGRGRDGHEVRAGSTLIINGTPRIRFRYFGFVWPEWPDGERGCRKR